MEWSHVYAELQHFRPESTGPLQQLHDPHNISMQHDRHQLAEQQFGHQRLP